ncbi:MAG: hypothetical protein LBL09_04450 [Oscillospiraceae bacterium]|nr:hypothetical protein [Oscillospiraceae bacterium]
MPSSMIHILLARKLKPDMPIPFMVGSLAPDAFNGTYLEKDKNHFRDLPDRLDALRGYAREADCKNEFFMGVLLHLYADYLWDREAVDLYKSGYNDNSWVASYRENILMTSNWLFHRFDWCDGLWRDMLSCPDGLLYEFRGISKPDIRGYLERNYALLTREKLEPSKLYTPEYTFEFVERAGEGFIQLTIDS